MLQLRAQFKLLLILLCIGIVMMRVGGAHLHYCFDGSEPPVSLHIDGHAGNHHKSGGVSSGEHADMDVSVGVEALIKKAPTLLDLLGLVAVVGFLLHLLPRTRPVVSASGYLLPFFSRRAFLRPPLRGPPR